MIPPMSVEECLERGLCEQFLGSDEENSFVIMLSYGGARIEIDPTGELLVMDLDHPSILTIIPALLYPPDETWASGMRWDSLLPPRDRYLLESLMYLVEDPLV
jgi:hypothetical protein